MRGYSHSFAGGELTPEFFGNIGDAKFQTGLAVCRNFQILPHGPAQNRAGFEFVREVKDSSKRVRLLPFTYSTTQTMVMETGDGYFRFHTQGATILSGGVPYEIASGYSQNDLFAIKYTQSSDVFTLVHTSYPPAELRRTAPSGVLTVTLSPISFAATLLPPTSIAAAATVPTTHGTPIDHTYAITSVASNNVDESLISASATCSNNLYDTGAFNTITWVEASNALRYNIYKSTNGLWGFIGQASGTSFVDDNITSDIGKTAPEGSDPFAGGSSISAVAVTAGGSGYKGYTGRTGPNRYMMGWPVDLTVTDSTGTGAVLQGVTDATTGAIVSVNVLNGGSGYTAPTVDALSLAYGSGATFGTPTLTGGNYPGSVAYFEQRRCFAGTVNKPQNLWMTRSGTESNLTYSIPTRDSDAVTFRVVAREANTVRHLVPMNNLLALTSAAEWRISSGSADAITPSSIDVKPQSYIGANDSQPVIVNNNVIYAAARGGHVRELAFNWQAGGYLTGDLSLRAPHLFDGLDIVDIAFSKAPYPVVWMVSSSGKLIGITYVPEQNIGAWHWHDTDGVFESCCVVAEGATDVLYVVVRRTIGGVQKRYVERMRPRAFETQADCFFVDSGATYGGVPTTSITGLTWLEGKTVNVLADGAVHRQLVVTGGAITLDYPASTVQVGLPIVADLQTLPLVFSQPGYGQGTKKNINKVFLRVKDSGGIMTGPSVDQLVPAKLRTNEPYGTPTRLQTGVIEVVNRAAWTDDGQVCVRQTEPLPLTITALTLDFTSGG